ncbi:MAG: hypothetical protein ACP5E3_08235 [Bacteroidales bacterium]
MRAAGIILIAGGIAATIAFVMRALQNSDSFQVFGMEVGVSTANWLPVFVSLAIIIVGIIFTRAGRKKKFQEGNKLS